MRVRRWVPSLGVVLGFLFGCSLLSAAGDHKVTFNKDVAPIVYNHCATCHRPDGRGPMSLLTYESARPFAAKMEKKVVAREMPPWGADPRYGKFLNDPHLSQQELDTLVAWVEGGALEGNPKDLPPLPTVAEGWTFKPDVIYEMPEAFKVPAKGVLDMQYFVVSPPFPEDRWVEKAQVRVGTRSVVHHSTIMVRSPRHDEAAHTRGDPLPGVVVLPKEQNSEEWATFKPTKIEIENKMDRARTAAASGGLGSTRPGFATLVPAGSQIVLQMHYNPDGTETTDRSKVGLLFAKAPPEREQVGVAIHNTAFVIPPGTKDVVVHAEATFLKDVHIWSLSPHMHVRGKNAEFRLTYPDGRTEILLVVPKYDFYNQQSYEFAEPLAVPKGSRLDCVAVFDNSAGNPLNPDPKATVRFGLQTSDEMWTGHLKITVDDQPFPTRTASLSQAPGPK